MNKKRYDYARIISDKEIQFAPIDSDLSGYFPFKQSLPENPKKYRYKLSCYSIEDGVIHPVWTTVEQWQRTYTYSKLKLIIKATELGKWDAIKKVLQESTIEGTTTTYWELWQAAQSFKSDDKYWKLGIAKVKDIVELDDDKLDDVLMDCIAD